MARNIKSNYIYKGKVLNLRLDQIKCSDGRSHNKEIIEYPYSVAIIAFTAPDQIILEKQYRHTVKDVIYEIPAGKIDPGETPLQAARRELKEETGYSAGKLKLLFSGFTAPGISTEYMYFFRADDLRQGQTRLEADEQIEVEIVSLKKAKNMIRKGAIKDNKTALGIMLVERRTSKDRRQRFG
jgi:ADP-ribose pyrophosphatase